METRQLVSVEDIVTVEVICSNERCKQIFTVNLERNALHQQQQCPGCGQEWWNSNRKKGIFNFLNALLDLKYGVDHPLPHAPTVRLVIPGPPA